MGRVPLSMVMAAQAAAVLLGKQSEEEPLSDSQRIVLIGISVGLVLMAGLMSGLTLGLMSLDMVDLEVLKRSGTDREQRYAAAIVPVVANQHFLLVTLLLCNAVSMEALPLFLDRLADPVTAIIISVTAVLLFGEIIPQAICTRYGLAIGYYCAWIVRLLMALTSPLSWPISKLLDALLGTDHKALFRRTQLKALVDIHGLEEGLGGNLTEDEIQVICGALDLTAKTAHKSMTPLQSVFMLPSEARLNREAMQKVLESGHSRIPVYADGDRTNIVGLLLVKELLAYRTQDEAVISEMRMRSLPRLPASTAMYDMLKLFRTGRSHMVVLTDAPVWEGGADNGADPRPHHAAQDPAPGPADPLVPGPEGGPRGFAAFGRESTRSHGLEEGHPIGIITIEDVIEELMQTEIVDETDVYVDNERTLKVNAASLASNLPAKLRAALKDDRLRLSNATSALAAAAGKGVKLQTAGGSGLLTGKVAIAKATLGGRASLGGAGASHRGGQPSDALRQPLLRRQNSM